MKASSLAQVRGIPIRETRIGTDRLLTDTRTGHSLRFGPTGVTETIWSDANRKRFCAAGSMRTLLGRDPRTRILTCCGKGFFDPSRQVRPGVTPGVCRRSMLAPIGIFHPPEKSAELEQRFREGSLQRRRAASFRVLKRLGAKIRIP